MGGARKLASQTHAITPLCLWGNSATVPTRNPGKKTSMRVHRILILTAGLALSLAAKADDITAEKDANLKRFLFATHFVEAQQVGAARAKLNGAFAVDPLAEKITHLSIDALASVMVATLRDHFTVEETRALAHFYASGAAQAITDQRPLTPAQQTAFDELYPAHEDVPQRMKSILQSPDFHHRESESVRALAAGNKPS